MHGQRPGDRRLQVAPHTSHTLVFVRDIEMGLECHAFQTRLYLLESAVLAHVILKPLPIVNSWLQVQNEYKRGFGLNGDVSLHKGRVGAALGDVVGAALGDVGAALGDVGAAVDPVGDVGGAGVAAEPFTNKFTLGLSTNSQPSVLLTSLPLRK